MPDVRRECGTGHPVPKIPARIRIRTGVAAHGDAGAARPVKRETDAMAAAWSVAGLYAVPVTESLFPRGEGRKERAA